MNDKWILFSYSVPAADARARMRIWRRISACGAVQLKTGLQILPNREDLRENITWLIGEVNALGGEAIAIQCARVEGMPDARIKKLFQDQVDPEFARIRAEAREVLDGADILPDDDRARELSLVLRKLRKRWEGLQVRDFFPSGAAGKTLALLDAAGEKLRRPPAGAGQAFLFDRSAFQGRTWVTRARPYLDRLGSFWLISRFIDPNAAIRFLEPGEEAEIAGDEVPFDMAGAEFSHQGGLVTFEVMAGGFGLADPSIARIGELVRRIDIQEEETLPDDAGLLKNLIDGLVAISTDDHQLLERGLLLFDALHAGYCRKNRAGDTS